MKPFDTAVSSDKMRAAKSTDAPFSETESGTVEVDYLKLAKLWAATQEALQGVGDGFVTVVEAIHASLKDNELSRDDNHKTRHEIRRLRATVWLSMASIFVFGTTMAIFMFVLVQQAREEIQLIQAEATSLRRETRILSRLQTTAIETQVATTTTENPEAEKKVLEAEVEVAKSKVQIADTPQEKEVAKTEAKDVLKRARSKAKMIGPMDVDLRDEMLEGL